MTAEALPIILYDSECTLCTRFAQALARLDSKKEFTLISLHEEWIYEKYTHLNKVNCQESLHVLIGEFDFLVGSQAIEYLITKLPGVKNIAWLIESENGKKALSFFYNHVNKLRTNKKFCKSCNGVSK